MMQRREKNLKYKLARLIDREAKPRRISRMRARVEGVVVRRMQREGFKVIDQKTFAKEMQRRR